MKHFMAKGGSDAPGGAASEEEEEAPAARRAAAGRPAPARAPAEPTEDAAVSSRELEASCNIEVGDPFKVRRSGRSTGRTQIQQSSCFVYTRRGRNGKGVAREIWQRMSA